MPAMTVFRDLPEIAEGQLRRRTLAGSFVEKDCETSLAHVAGRLSRSQSFFDDA
jgi:hypothetical protein